MNIRLGELLALTLPRCLTSPASGDYLNFDGYGKLINFNTRNVTAAMLEEGKDKLSEEVFRRVRYCARKLI